MKTIINRLRKKMVLKKMFSCDASYNPTDLLDSVDNGSRVTKVLEKERDLGEPEKVSFYTTK